MPITVAVLRELRSGERRVALVPSALQPLQDAGVTVVVEAGAGLSAGFPDQQYEEAGGEVVAGLERVLDNADAILKVQAPLDAAEEERDEVGVLREGSVLIGLLDPLQRIQTIERLAERGVTTFSLELVPRVTRAQKMDALSSQATVGGYRAALLGATNLGRFFPMLMTAAGTVPPAKVLVLGAGVAGLQAIATCRRLGATVSAFDVRPAVKEQVESLGAKFVEAELEEDAETTEGYARALSDEEHEKELRLIALHAKEMDVVITTAQIPGRPAPLLLTEEMIRSMKPGSVIVDMATASGGNCALSEMDTTVERHGVRILGPTNLPSELPTHASQMYGRNIGSLLLHLVREERIDPDWEDEIVTGCCVTHAGEIRHPRVAAALAERGEADLAFHRGEKEGRGGSGERKEPGAPETEDSDG